MGVCLDTTCCFGYTHDLLEKWRAQIQKSLYQKWEHWISGYKKIASVSCDKKSHPFECNSQLAQRPHQLDGLPLCHFTFGSFFTFHPLCSKDYETRWLFSSQHLLLLKLVINVVGFKVFIYAFSVIKSQTSFSQSVIVHEKGIQILLFFSFLHSYTVSE